MPTSKFYTDTFYNSYKGTSRGSAEQVLPYLIQFFSPNAVVDVGCGIGTWLSVCKELGVGKILGIDGDYVNRSQLMISIRRLCCL